MIVKYEVLFSSNIDVRLSKKKFGRVQLMCSGPNGNPSILHQSRATSPSVTTTPIDVFVMIALSKKKKIKICRYFSMDWAQK